MKICTVVGARPQFIKAAPVSRALAGVEEILIHTGQHYDSNMSDVFFSELGIPRPNYCLDVGSGSGRHGEQTALMLQGIEKILLEECPDWTLVYGDTNSTLAGALAAAKLNLPLAHIEAGLRSHNRKMPEEINRILTDHASDILFVPSEAGRENLLKEGISEEKILSVGDVMFDAALYFGERAESQSRILNDLALERGGYVLCSIHRAENTDDVARLRAVFSGLNRVAESLPVILPLHPRTKVAIARENFDVDVSRIRFIAPVGYLDMVVLERNARLIATDSGGVQKEAFFYGKPCVTLRDETEWTELVDLGWNLIVSPESSEIVAETILSNLDSVGRQGAPYGAGNAATAIADRLIRN